MTQYRWLAQTPAVWCLRFPRTFFSALAVVKLEILSLGTCKRLFR
jgi:hypothetical protein